LNRWLIPLFISRCRPNRSVDLLLRANLAPDHEAARAWRGWLRLRSVEDATWPEVRLLAPLARRIVILDPCCPFRARLEGLAKAYWAQTQLILRDSASALGALANAGIDYLLLKGAAHYAEGLAPATRRIMADIDILVRSEVVAMASDRLCKEGWLPKHGGSPAMFRDEKGLISRNYQKGEFGHIDLHQHVFHFSRRDCALDAGLWESARRARFANRSVLIPSVADSIVITIAHGVRNGDGDWALDLAYRIRTCQIAWDRVAYIADRRGLVPSVLAGLSYLRILGSDIPKSVLDCLCNLRPTIGEYLKYLDETMMRETRYSVPSRLVNGAHRIANAFLPRDRYEYRW